MIKIIKMFFGGALQGKAATMDMASIEALCDGDIKNPLRSSVTLWDLYGKY